MAAPDFVRAAAMFFLAPAKHRTGRALGGAREGWHALHETAG
jgi:hypothetical protein